MPHANGNRRVFTRTAKPTLAAMFAMLLACLGLAACGSSSNSSSTSTATTSTTAASAAPKGALGARLTALRECLHKDGITAPAGSGGFLGGGTGPQLPKGVSRAQYEAGLKKCGVGSLATGSTFNSPKVKDAIARFAACMRENGVKSSEDSAAALNTKSLESASPQFRAASKKCTPALSKALAPHIPRIAPGRIATPG